MKLLPVILALALLGAMSCGVRANEAEERRRAEAAAKAEAEKREARRRADEEAALKRGGMQDLLYRIPPPKGPTGDALFEQASALEQQGRGAEAVRLYQRAALDGGSGKAALRLARIYEQGIPGVTRDYDLSLRWYSAARVLGEDVPAKKP